MSPGTAEERGAAPLIPGVPASVLCVRSDPPRADLGTFSGEADSKWSVWLRRLEIIWEQATHPIL